MDIYQRAEEQIIEKQKIVDFDIKEFTIELLTQKYLNGLLEDDNDIFIPEYQRNFVWNEERQSKFIESVLLGLPIPYIFTADTDGRLEIVDGSQRLRTIVAFINDELTLCSLEILAHLNGFKYSNLMRSRQRKIQNTTIRMIALSDKSDEDVRYMMFERINTGSELLRDMEKRKGMFAGKFLEFIYKECSNHPLYLKNTRFTDKLSRRGEPQELITRFFAYANNLNEFKGNVNEFLNNYVDNCNKAFNKKTFFSDFDRMLNFVDSNMPLAFIKTKTSRKTPRVRFDAIAVGTILALREDPNLKVKSIRWLESGEFNNLITSGGQNSSKAITNRITYVKDRLLG